MRFLFSFVGGSGHFLPLVPIARAAEQAGHTIAVACGHWMLAVVERAGIAARAIGPKPTATVSPRRLPLQPVDMAREERDLAERFVRGAAATRADGLLSLCKTWEPDVMVCDEVDFGCMIAAQVLDIPYASVVVIAEGSFIRPDVVGEALDEVRASYGLPPDPALDMLSRHLILSPVPPGYRNPSFPLPATGHSIRPSFDAPSSGPPARHIPHASTIYFTLGTIFNTESGDLFQRVLTGLSDLRANIFMTVGRHVDPAEFGPQPPHIHIAQYIPQAQLLPHCDLVISHGGSGSVMGALAHGLPMVLIPMGADQPLNGRRCVELGVAQVLDPIALTPASIHEAVSTVLADPAYRHAAERLRDEIEALPGPDYAVTLLEQLG